MQRDDVAFGLLLAMSISEHRGSPDAVVAEAFKRADAFLAQCDDDDDNPQAGSGGFDFEIDESELAAKTDGKIPAIPA